MTQGFPPGAAPPPQAPAGYPGGYPPPHPGGYVDQAAAYQHPQHMGSPVSPASPFTPGPASPMTPLDPAIPQAATPTGRGKTLRAAGMQIASVIGSGANWAQARVDAYADNKISNTPHHGESPKQVGSAHMSAAKSGARFAGVVHQATGAAVGVFTQAAGAVGRAVVPKPGENPGAVRQYATAAVGAVVDVTNAAKTGAKGVVGTGADRAKEYMHHAHGPQKAELYGHYGNLAKHSTGAALNVTEFTPTGFVKKAAIAGLVRTPNGAPPAGAPLPGAPGPAPMSPHGAPPVGYPGGPPPAQGGYYGGPPPPGVPPPAAYTGPAGFPGQHSPPQY